MPVATRARRAFPNRAFRRLPTSRTSQAGGKRTTLSPSFAKMSDYGADSISLTMTRTSSEISESSEELRGREEGDGHMLSDEPFDCVA